MTTRSRPRRAFCGAAVLAIATTIGTSACGGSSSDVKREQERIDALSARISSLESDLSQLQSEVPAASTSSTSSSGG